MGVIFDIAADTLDEKTTKRIRSLESALGNAGNNQITNSSSGVSGPRFYLEKIHVIDLSSKPVMAVQGYFHGFDGQVHNHYMGIFFDATPDDRDYCQIEEIVFQAPTWELFGKYFPQFQKTLNSIRW